MPMPEYDVSAIVAACGADHALYTHWAQSFIALGTMISVLGAFTGLTTATYAFTVLRQPHLSHWYNFYSMSAGVSIGGSAIWTMHFVGMQALVLTTCTGVHVPHQFNAGITFASLIAACAIGGLCMYLVMPIGSSGGSDVAQLWRLPFKLRGHSLYLGKFSPARFAAATIALVAGVCIMHNMGMLAMSGPYVTYYDPAIVFASAALALVASAAGLFIVVQCAYVGAAWYSLLLRFIAALVIALAVNSVHYTGMLAATYHFTGDPRDNLMYGLGHNMDLPALAVLMVALTVTVVQLLGTHAHIAGLASVVTKVTPLTPATTGTNDR